MKTPLPLLLFTLFLFSTTASRAQSNFKPGRMVTHQGDTVRGFVDHQEWSRSPAAFSFKAKPESQQVEPVSPATARYVAIDGLEAYRQYEGPISQNQVLLSKLPADLDTSTLQQSVFLKVLQEGPNVSLYAYRDHIKTRFFLKHHDQERPEELLYRIYYQDPDPASRSNQSRFTRESKLYVGQLWLAAQKYGLGTPELQQQLQTLTYAEPDLVKTVRKLNGLGKEKTKWVAGSQPRTRFFVGLGVNSAWVDNVGKNVMTVQYVWDAASSSLNQSYRDRKATSLGPKFNAGLDYLPFPNTQKLVLRTEVTVAFNDFEYVNTHSLKNPDRELLYVSSFKQTLVSLAPQVLYNVYNGDRLKFHVGMGAAYNRCFYPENRLHITPLSPGVNGDKELIADDYMGYAKTWVNFPLRAGLEWNRKLELSFLYWTPALLIDATGTVSSLHSSQIGINYLFSRR